MGVRVDVNEELKFQQKKLGGAGRGGRVAFRGGGGGRFGGSGWM